MNVLQMPRMIFRFQMVGPPDLDSSMHCPSVRIVDFTSAFVAELLTVALMAWLIHLVCSSPLSSADSHCYVQLG